VLARVETLGGAVQTERLAPTRTSFVVQATPTAGDVAVSYLRLGVEHILFGFDHLLFVLALVILVRDWRRVVLTVTAFTVAHSLTLAAATLGFVSVPGPPIEAAIALSIVLVAVEIIEARRGKTSLAARWPWLIAFCFGLLHGFGFAGALAEVGLPHHAIPIALLFFNLGVEIGQLAFVAAVLGGLVSAPGAVAGALLLGIIESFEPKTTRAFTLEIKTKEPAAFKPKLEELLKRTRWKHELREQKEDGLSYDVQVPLDRKTDRISEQILNLDPKNVTVEWKEKKEK